jgi:hypothetical protein
VNGSWFPDKLRVMRALATPPASLLVSAREPALGSFDGALPPIDWTPLKSDGTLNALREKHWIYLTLASDALHVAVAVVDLAYATKVFAFVFEKASRRVVARESLLAPPRTSTLAAHLDAKHLVDFRLGSSLVSLERDGSAVKVRVQLGTIHIDAELDDAGAPPSIGAVVDLGNGRFHATEKRTLVGWRGGVSAGDERWSVREGVAGFDFSRGFPHRATNWHWGFFLGESTEGEPVAMNLVEGFVGEAECAVWFRGRVHGVGEGRFTFDTRRPYGKWHVRSTDGAVDLELIPCDVHEEFMELGIIGARYRQPIGLFSGTLTIAGEAVRIEKVVGVVEDQRVRW